MNGWYGSPIDRLITRTDGAAGGQVPITRNDAADRTMDEIDPRVILGCLLRSSAEAVRTHDRPNVETLARGLLVRAQVAVQDQRRHRRTVTATRYGVGLGPFVGIVHNEAAGEPTMVLQRKAIQECDERIAKLVFLAFTLFLLLLGFLRDDRRASLSSRTNKANLVTLQKLDLRVVEHALDRRDRELAHERVVRDLVDRAARQHLAVRACDELADAPLCRRPLFGLSKPELDLDSDGLEAGRDTIAPEGEDARLLEPIANAPAPDVAKLPEDVEPASVLLRKTSIRAPRAPKGEQLLHRLLVEEHEVELCVDRFVRLVRDEEVRVGREVAEVLVGQPFETWRLRDRVVKVLHGAVRLEDQHLLEGHARCVTLKRTPTCVERLLQLSELGREALDLPRLLWIAWTAASRLLLRYGLLRARRRNEKGSRRRRHLLLPNLKPSRQLGETRCHHGLRVALRALQDEAPLDVRAELLELRVAEAREVLVDLLRREP
jgi:hypothetical protein